MKGKMIRILAALLVSAICGQSAASAVSYPPEPLYHRQEAGEAVTRGGAVYLFHSGVSVIKKTIHPGDILPIYRVSSSCKITEAGRIRIVSFLGDTYLKGEVIEGEIKPGDIAKKGAISCLVISAGMCEHSQ